MARTITSILIAITSLGALVPQLLGSHGSTSTPVESSIGQAVDSAAEASAQPPTAQPEAVTPDDGADAAPAVPRSSKEAAEPTLAFEFDELAIRVAAHLAGDRTADPLTIDDWVTWLDVAALDHGGYDAARNRMRSVPADVLPDVLDRVVGGRTDNPYLLQLLWDPYLRLRGTSLDQLAARLRDHLGLAPIESTSRPTRCTAAQFERGDDEGTQGGVDPQQVIDGVLSEIAASGPDSLRSSLELMGDQGGTVRFAPDELRTADVVAMRRGPNLIVGAAWIDAAAGGTAGVHANLAHELGGHLFYGRPLSCLIALHALDGPGDVPGVASYQELFLRYGYAETEVYAELKEMPHRTSDSVGDHPVDDIPLMIEAIQEVFPTDLADLVLDWMTFRFERDATLTDDAIEYFRTQVRLAAAG